MELNDFARLAGEFTIIEVNDVFLVQHKSGKDYPYRIKKFDEGFRLEKSFSPRAYINPTFKKVKDARSVKDLVDFIVKKHNKAAKSYMAGVFVPIV